MRNDQCNGMTLVGGYWYNGCFTGRWAEGTLWACWNLIQTDAERNV